MLELDHDLPPGALCDRAADALHAALADLPALWWHGDEAAFATDPKTRAIAAWRPRMGRPDAVPTAPNTGNALIGDAGDLTGLQCRAGVHSGLVADAAVDDAATATLALRYLPPHDDAALTLLTLNTGGAARKSDGENYLFLSESDGILTVKDDAGLVELTLPLPAPDQPRMVIVSLAGDRLAATVQGGASVTAMARAPVLSGAASLFFGCRNHRPGLLKTLGGALIADVWAFPGRALLLSDLPEDTATLTALNRYALWAGDSAWP